MRTVVIVGSRHRGWTRQIDHISLIQAIIDPRKDYYREGLSVASIGCDIGFGKAVKEYCEENGIKFFEFVVYFNGPREKAEYTQAYQARHAALLDVGDEFHITVSKTRRSAVEDLVTRVQGSSKTYVLYDEDNTVLEMYDAGEPDEVQEEGQEAPVE
jgi:hypothetical protein